MDPEQVNKPSGIPRPSRLPVSRNKEVIDPKKPNALSRTASPKLQKRQSIPSLHRPSQNGIKQPASSSKPFAARSNASNKTRPPAKVSTNNLSSAARPSSRGNQQKQQPPRVKSSLATEDEENHDQLSALDSFRSASRQGSRDGSPPETLEFIEPTFLPKVPQERKSSRPSLSDRTIESLQNVPATPKDRRRSSFFSPESPMGPPPRPNSSLSRNGSNPTSRPGTSDGTFGNPSNRPPSVAKKASSTKPASRTSLGGFGFTPNRSMSGASAGKREDSNLSIPPLPSSPSPSKRTGPAALSDGAGGFKTSHGSKTVAARPSRQRPAVADAFGPAIRAGSVTDNHSDGGALAAQAAPPKSSKSAAPKIANSSSAALRQQISAAKAAARKDKSKSDEVQDMLMASRSHTGFELHDDPFNQVPKDEKHILRNRIRTARMDSKLNIAALELKRVPEEVLTMYDAASMEDSKVSWAEVVDLTKFNAADNELEIIDDAVFPDVSLEELAMDDDTPGNQFGGLEMLDLHRNQLRALPMGLRRLERLTTLNLTHNKLENDALDIISQITPLKDLKMGHNSLSGNLAPSICNLPHLELLDLQGNRLLSLPEAIGCMTNLRVVNLAENQLTALPMDALESLPLTDLDASSNALVGSLFPQTGSNAHPTLRTLRVANNSLASLAFADALDLPQLRSLDVTNNRLTGLPQVSRWTQLITIMAGDNKVTQLPDGFAELRNLRNVNFTSNELRLLDPAIARMESLESLILASNPLREKKFLNMNAADIKKDLRARLEPTPSEEDNVDDQDFHDARDSLSPSSSSPTSKWIIQAGGKLDLSEKGYTDDINDLLGAFLQRNEVKQLHMSLNKLTAIPPALRLGQQMKVLDLSGNAFRSDYLADELSLPVLQELSISRCGITTLDPLTTLLQAPNLQTLNIAINRLTGDVPTLRKAFPALLTLFAGDNKFTSVTADSLRGLQAVNIASNDIQQLPAEIGLLWNENLRSLEVGSNAFRVPNHRVLDKGTEALMKYLRDRIPAAEATPVVNGDSNGDDVD